MHSIFSSLAARKFFWILLLCIAIVLFIYAFFGLSVFAQVPTINQVTENVAQNTRVDTTIDVVVKVAPGEFLPISIKLSNFGGGERIDVTVSYKIISLAGKQIYSGNETVAVQTTANFLKTIQIPFGTISGRYIAQSSIIYQGQVTPAVTEFPFIVERKIFGLFEHDFYWYGGIMLLVSFLVIIVAMVMIYTWRRHRRNTRLAVIDYSDIPHDKRIFYEILSDTITGMRQRVGDQALIIAANIDGLKIDEKTNRVLGFNGSPSKIITTLVSEYEKLLGKKVSFTLRKEETSI